MNTAVFNVCRYNVATLFTPSTEPNADVQLVTFDSQLTNGEEVSLIAKITDQWSVLANATHQEAVVTTAPNAIATIGNHPQGVPANMANFWSTYKFAIGGISGFQLGIGANYRDRTWSDTTNVNSVPGSRTHPSEGRPGHREKHCPFANAHLRLWIASPCCLMPLACPAVV